jgi:transposase InsO family protein
LTNDDLLFRHRKQLFKRAGEVGVRRACAELGYHHSTYYYWLPLVERHGLEILRPRERRRPRMPNETPQWLEQRVIAFALAFPGLGRSESPPNSVNRVGGRSRSRRAASTRSCAGMGWGPGGEGSPWLPATPGRHLWSETPFEPNHIEATLPGDLVQVDCFHVGRLTGTQGRVWQYTAVDVASSFIWAELHVTPLNPAARFTSQLVHRVAQELSLAGWKLKAVTTDNASEFRSSEFRATVESLGVEQRFIRAGRPQTNGVVERAQRTVLEECWRPSFARSLAPKSTALRRDLEQYLDYFNFERAHTGRLTKGRPPGEVVYGSRKMRPR